MTRRIIDLSHHLSSGMLSYPWTPVPTVTEWVTREQAAEFLAPGVSFHIAHVTMAGNSGTYLNAPYQFHVTGPDIASIPLDWLIDVPIVVIPALETLEIGPEVFAGHDDFTGKAVLIHTGHDRRWGTKEFFKNSPHLTPEAVTHLTTLNPRIVAIDSQNLDDGKNQSKPAQHNLLANNILALVSLTNLDQLPASGATLTVLPPPVAGMGSFPTRPIAITTG